MAQGEDIDDATASKLISQATVRRDVVIRLIQAMKDRGHREYSGYNMAQVREHAEAHLVPNIAGMTPAIPKEVFATLNKKLNVDKHRPGKASSPPDPLAQEGEDAHATAKVTAVTMEASTDVEMDMNVRTGTAYMTIAERLNEDTGEDTMEDQGSSERTKLRILTGGPRSQLEATFFMAAFPFLFPYSIGAPDLKYQSRDRRVNNNSAAPVVDFVDDWSALIVQRAEAQFRRDLQFPFAVWNLVFRTIVNIGSNLYAVSKAATEESNNDAGDIDGTVFRDAALTVLEALGDKYRVGNMTLPVDGDLQKVRNTSAVQNNSVAQKLLSSLQATFKQIEGTQEIRTLMRHEITAFRVFYGVPIMVTFAPNEKHSTLMIRLSRMRGSDPMATHCKETMCAAQIPWPPTARKQWNGKSHGEDFMNQN